MLFTNGHMVDYISGLGWTKCKNGFWASPYIGNYMEGATMSLEFAYYIERLIVDNIKSDIIAAIKK